MQNGLQRSSGKNFETKIRKWMRSILNDNKKSGNAIHRIENNNLTDNKKLFSIFKERYE